MRTINGFEIKINSSCPPAMAALIHDQSRRMVDEQADWVAHLRALGVRAAHPDDGWVDREANTVRLEYPQFGGRLAVGDLLALGSPRDDTRIVRITGTIAPGPIIAPCLPPGVVWRYSFESAND
jgi:hypothetical protein